MISVYGHFQSRLIVLAQPTNKHHILTYHISGDLLFEIKANLTLYAGSPGCMLTEWLTIHLLLTVTALRPKCTCTLTQMGGLM